MMRSLRVAQIGNVYSCGRLMAHRFVSSINIIMIEYSETRLHETVVSSSTDKAL
jgi:hypothetical protein